MQPSGASVNDIQPKVILSLLQRATPPTEVIDTVVDATMDMATRNGLPWTREVELKCVDRRVDCDLKKLQDEYDYRTGEVPRWLAEEFHQKWADTLAKGGRPRLSRNRHNKHLFSVWAYGARQRGAGGGKEEPRGGARRIPMRALPVPDRVIRGHAARDAEPLYLIDELIPVKGLVDIWGKPKCFKSFVDPRHDAARQPWAGNITTAASARVRLSIARSKALTATRSGSRRCGGTTRSPTITHVPLYIMPGQANLIKDHVRLIADLKAQLGAVAAGGRGAGHAEQVPDRVRIQGHRHGRLHPGGGSHP